MKTLTFLVCVLVVAALTGSAATVSSLCVGNNGGTAGSPPGTNPTDIFAAGAGTVVNTCPSLEALLGGSLTGVGTLTGVSVETDGSYDGGATTGTNSYVETSTLSTNVFGSWSLSPTVNTGSGGVAQTSSNNPQTSNAGSGLTLTNAASSFTITATSSVTGGSMTDTTETKIVTYTYNPPTSTPEPGVFSMIGVGLIGLAILGRKFRKQV